MEVLDKKQKAFDAKETKKCTKDLFDLDFDYTASLKNDKEWIFKANPQFKRLLTESVQKDMRTFHKKK